MALSLSRLALLGATLCLSLPLHANVPDASLIEQGKYVAQLGDCIACHTAKQGKEMAGGLELSTPMGTIYSSNITPDRETGIGAYTFEAFDRVMREGVTPTGMNLYPAMPYPSYAKMSETDMRALFTYLMQGVEPVQQANLEADMGFPFNQRWGLALWNFVFLDKQPFKPDPARDEQLNRGAYLVQGLGHCGSCHTPRGIAFQEKAMSDEGSSGQYYLAGETVEHWRALSLRNLWTVEDTVQLLKTGQNRFATVAGNMADVIHHSTQHFSDYDLTAIASYLKSLPLGKDDLPMPSVAQAPAVPPADVFTSRGGLGYMQFCSDCHRSDGAGVKGLFPPLAGNPSIASSNPTSLLHITLTGWETAQTATHPRIYTMPGFARLNDQEIAEILSFVRTRWGNEGTPISAGQVKKLRDQLNPATTDSSAFETPRLAELLAAPNADQVIRGMRLHLQTKELLPNNVGNSLNCTSCHLNAGTVADGSPFVGVSAFFPSYAPRAGKVVTLEERINGCFRRSMNGKPTAATIGRHASDGRLFRLDEKQHPPRRQSSRARRGQGRPGDQAGPGQWQTGLRQAMRGVPWRQRPGPGTCRWRADLPAAVGRPIVQHRCRHGAHLHGSGVRQTQHADWLPREIPAGAGRFIGPGSRGCGGIFLWSTAPGLPGQDQGLAERR